MKKSNDNLATILGLLTTLYSALILVDLDTLDYNLPSTYMKLIGIILPTIGGYFSTVKSKN